MYHIGVYSTHPYIWQIFFYIASKYLISGLDGTRGLEKRVFESSPLVLLNFFAHFNSSLAKFMQCLSRISEISPKLDINAEIM